MGDQLCCLLRSQATPTHSKPNLIKMDPAPLVHSIFDKSTGTWQYLVADPATRKAAVIDSVLDFDPATQKVTTDNADAILRLIESNNYQIQWILETHIHADHLTAAAYLQGRLAGQQQDGTPRIGIGKRITQVQKTFAGKYNVSWDECEGVFDKMFDDDEEFPLGNLKSTSHPPPGPHARSDGLCLWRQRLLRRLHLPRGHWHRALRFPRRQCKAALPVRAETPRHGRSRQDLDGPRLPERCASTRGSLSDRQ